MHVIYKIAAVTQQPQKDDQPSILLSILSVDVIIRKVVDGVLSLRDT